MFKGKIGSKSIMEIRILLNMETFFLPKFFGREFYRRFRKLLKQASINSVYAHHNPRTPIVIEEAVQIWPEHEEIMADVYRNERRTYIIVTIMKDQDKKYENK